MEEALSNPLDAETLEGLDEARLITETGQAMKVGRIAEPVLRDLGLPTAPFAAVDSAEDMERAVAALCRSDHRREQSSASGEQGVRRGNCGDEGRSGGGQGKRDRRGGQRGRGGE